MLWIFETCEYINNIDEWLIIPADVGKYKASVNNENDNSLTHSNSFSKSETFH